MIYDALNVPDQNTNDMVYDGLSYEGRQTCVRFYLARLRSPDNVSSRSALSRPRFAPETCLYLVVAEGREGGMSRFMQDVLP